MLLDKQNDSIVFTFGRFNPPHSGHEKLIKYVKELAKLEQADALMVVTDKVDKNNPLHSEKKLDYCYEAFDIPIRTTMFNVRSILDVLVVLEEHQYKDVTVVLGSDRTDLIELVNKYNDELYFFDTLNTVLYTRQDDISSTDMRRFVATDNLKEFVNHCPKKLPKKLKKKLFEDVKRGLL